MNENERMQLKKLLRYYQIRQRKNEERVKERKKEKYMR